MRSINVALITEKNKLDSPGVWIDLLQVDIPTVGTLYLARNTEPVTFDGNTYTPFGCSINSIPQDLRGGLEEVEVSVSNVTREFSAYVEQQELRGARVKLITVSSLHLGDPTAMLEEIDFEINEISVQEEVVSFRLGHERLLQQNFPGMRYLRNNCRWIYKSVECGYVGSLPTCDKVLEGDNGCRAHANTKRFGGFPGLPNV